MIVVLVIFTAFIVYELAIYGLADYRFRKASALFMAASEESLAAAAAFADVLREESWRSEEAMNVGRAHEAEATRLGQLAIEQKERGTRIMNRGVINRVVG